MNLPRAINIKYCKMNCKKHDKHIFPSTTKSTVTTTTLMTRKPNYSQVFREPKSQTTVAVTNKNKIQNPTALYPKLQYFLTAHSTF